MAPTTKHFTIDEATALARRACMAVGASEPAAHSLARATVSAEMAGMSGVGFRHLPDYLASFAEGRIDGGAEPVISFPASAMVLVDGRGGIAQLGFDRAFDEVLARATDHGVAVMAQRNTYTTGELGYYVRRFSDVGLMVFAASNGPPMLTSPGVRSAVYGTNPMAFAARGDAAASVLIDQASSATAYVNVRSAAEAGETLPPGWAVDADGEPTQDPAKALDGSLLPFGGGKGANVALMIEILAGGLTGANWSMDAPSFTRGDASPGAGLLVIAIKPTAFDPRFSTRLRTQLARLSQVGVHVPGQGKAAVMAEAMRHGLNLPLDLVARIEGFAGEPLGN